MVKVNHELNNIKKLKSGILGIRSLHNNGSDFRTGAKRKLIIFL